MRLSIIATTLLLLLINGCSNSDSDGDTSIENPYTGYSSELYEAQENWLCRPDIEGEANVCNGDLNATLVFADGSTQLESPVIADTAPAIDCFYVYPTVSYDPGGNSDLVADKEIAATYTQAARYRSVCKLFAPLYRQITIPSLFEGNEAYSELAYADVLDAFKHFIAQGEGRGYILLGHSQGTMHLIRLIQQEIELQPWLAQRMISAHLLGLTIELPNDADTGATFQSTPPCTFERNTHCFVNYASFREDVPPEPETAIFGLARSADTRAACTHPNQLGGGKLNLDAYFNTSQFQAYTDPASNESITTAFVKVPGLIQGECVEQDARGYLAISVDADPSDPRTDDTGGDLAPGWGLHLIDVSLAQGDLISLAGIQLEAWLEELD